MKKENIFDLYEAQHKDDPAPAADRVPGEVKPEDVAPTQEVKPAPEPKQEPVPEPKQEPAPEPPQDPEPKQEGGTDNGV